MARPQFHFIKGETKTTRPKYCDDVPCFGMIYRMSSVEAVVLTFWFQYDV